MHFSAVIRKFIWLFTIADSISESERLGKIV